MIPKMPGIRRPFVIRSYDVSLDPKAGFFPLFFCHKYSGHEAIMHHKWTEYINANLLFHYDIAHNRKPVYAVMDKNTHRVI